MRLLTRSIAFATLLLVGLTMVQAHEARPLYIEIDEQASGEFTLQWRVPPTVTPDNQPALMMPSGCQSIGPSRQVRGPDGDIQSQPFLCDGGIGGETLSVAYPRINPSVSTLARISWLSGQRQTLLAGPEDMAITLPLQESGSRVAGQYFTLGWQHILEGYDHLLFLVCLLFIAGSVRRIIITVTGFTVAHSLTLALAALGIVRIPVPPVEAAIALSIVFLASEIARGRSDSLTWRYPIAVSSSFGLLHGLGFASVLGQIGLPQTEVTMALLFFNVGVEAGQLAFVLAMLALFWTGRKALLAAKLAATGPVPAAQAASYGVGILASYWMIERIAGF